MARGYAVFTIFNKIKAKDIYFQVKGYEVPGEYTPAVIESLRKGFKKTRTLNASQASNRSKMSASQSMRRNSTRL